jgi:hypothetical protein
LAGGLGGFGDGTASGGRVGNKITVGLSIFFLRLFTCKKKDTMTLLHQNKYTKTSNVK